MARNAALEQAAGEIRELRGVLRPDRTRKRRGTRPVARACGRLADFFELGELMYITPCTATSRAAGISARSIRRRRAGAPQRRRVFYVAGWHVPGRHQSPC